MFLRFVVAGSPKSQLSQLDLLAEGGGRGLISGSVLEVCIEKHRPYRTVTPAVVVMHIVMFSLEV